MAGIIWDSEGIFLVEFLNDDRCHNKFRAICADIKSVNSTNLKGSAK
jgi:hypothetical protein